MQKLKLTLMAGLLGLTIAGGPAAAQSVVEVATVAARVDRSDPEAVRAVQLALQELGFYAGPVDGVFGQLTYEAAVAAVSAANEAIAAQQTAAAALSASPDEGDDGTSDLRRADPEVGTGMVEGPDTSGPTPGTPAQSNSSSGANVSNEEGGQSASTDAAPSVGAEAGIGESVTGPAASD